MKSRAKRTDVVRIHPTISIECKSQLDELVEDEDTNYECMADVIEESVNDLYKDHQEGKDDSSE